MGNVTTFVDVGGRGKKNVNIDQIISTFFSQEGLFKGQINYEQNGVSYV